MQHDSEAPGDGGDPLAQHGGAQGGEQPTKKPAAAEKGRKTPATKTPHPRRGRGHAASGTDDEEDWKEEAGSDSGDERDVGWFAESGKKSAKK